jgi:dTDP-4-amino-4,6-dideoxygalactose transaminase
MQLLKNKKKDKMSETRKIPFFNYPYVFTSYEEDILSIIRDVGRRGAFILQRDLEEFEKNIAKYVGAKYAIGVGNATDGLHLALRAAGIGPGDEVIFCSHTMVATASAIYFTGATPVPVDCGSDHLIDPQAVEEAITPRTKVILPTQLNGRTADMDALQSIAEKYNLIIIEDAAQALGSKFKGKCAGTFGLAGVVSFYPAKTLGCLGDGGIVFTNDEEMYRKIKMLRDHGRDETGEVVLWGFNSRLDNIQAAILNYKLKFYEREIARRREIARLYHKLLEDVKELLLPPPPDSDPDHFDIYQNYEIEAERRDELREYLSKNGIGTIIQWGGKAVHQFERLGFNVKLPYTEKMFKKCLLLPMNSSLTDDDVYYVANKIREFYGYGKKN